MTFSRAVNRGSRLKLWKTKPIRRLRSHARSDSESRVTSRPSISCRPLVGRSRKPSRLINVVFPEPEAPISATISRRAIDSDTPRSTGTSIDPRT